MTNGKAMIIHLIVGLIKKTLYKMTQSCNIGEYLDYRNCKCRKRLIDQLVEECGEDINGMDVMIYQ